MRSRGTAFIVFSLTVLLLAAGTAMGTSQGSTDTENWLEIDYDLELSEDLSRVLLEGEVDLRKMERPDMDDPWVDAALEDECGDSCSAQDLRKIYQEHEDHRDELVRSLESQVEDQTASMLTGLTGPSPEVDATVDRDTLEQAPEGSPFDPPVLVDVTGSGDVAMMQDVDYGADQIKALFEMGARVDVPVDAPVDPGTNLTLTLHVQSPIAVLDATSGALGQDTSSVEWTVSNWNSTQPASVSDEPLVGHNNVVVPDEEKLDVDVIVDLSNVQAHYLKALTGGTPASVTAELRVSGTLSAMEVPDDVDTSHVNLDVLSADAVRIAMDAGLISENRLVDHEEEARVALDQALNEMAAEDVEIRGGFVTETLNTDALGDPLGTGDPIQMDVSASGTISLPPEEDPLSGSAGFEVTRVDQGVLELPQIPTPGDRPANVTLLLPPGIDLDYESVQSGDVQTSITEDGLTAVTFTTGGDEDPTTVQGAEFVVNSPFLWHLFWPVLVFLFLVLVVLPAVVIFVVVRRRREEDDDDEPPGTRVPGGYDASQDSETPTPRADSEPARGEVS